MKNLVLLSIFLLSINTLAINKTIIVGENFQIKTQGRIWVEDKDFIEIQEINHGFQIKGIKKGSTQIKYDDQEVNLNVLNLEQMRTLKILNNLTAQSIALKVVVQNGRVSLQGKLLRWFDFEKIVKQCATMLCQFDNDLYFQHELKNIFEKKMLEELRKNSLPAFKINGSHPLSINIPQKFSKVKELTKILNKFGIAVFVDETSIELAPLVKVQITVAEVKKSEISKLGIKWPNSYQAKILPKAEGLVDTQFINPQLLEQNGYGKVLASPNLICRSGKEAEFLAGGEIPIKILNFKFQDVIWKKYGVVLKVKPLADYNGRMSISLETEVSSIDPNHSVDGIPGFFTNKVQSHFDLIEPKTIALSGLIKNEESQNTEGLPFLLKIPVLGRLFSSNDFRNDKSELVIFVRPEIVKDDLTDQNIILPE